jgi:hypothetical protein
MAEKATLNPFAPNQEPGSLRIRIIAVTAVEKTFSKLRSLFVRRLGL